MLTYLGYIILPLVASLFTKSWTFPVAMTTIVHFMIIRPVGWGWVNDYEADVYYPLIATISSIAGYILALSFSLRNIFTRIVMGEVDALIGPDAVLRRVVRLLKFAFICVWIAASLISFEMADPAWSGAITTVGMMCVPLAYWLLFRSWPVVVAIQAMGSLRAEGAMQIGDYLVSLNTTSSIGHFWYDSFSMFRYSASMAKTKKTPVGHFMPLYILWLTVFTLVPTIIFWFVMIFSPSMQFYAALGTSLGLLTITSCVGLIANRWRLTEKL